MDVLHPPNRIGAVAAGKHTKASGVACERVKVEHHFYGEEFRISPVSVPRQCRRNSSFRRLKRS